MQAYFNLSNSDTISIISKSPYVALMAADYGFMNYKSGVYYCNFSATANDLNHAVAVVGYDSNGNIMIKNSWGKSWGANGFGWISANSSRNCGLNLFSYALSSSISVSGSGKAEAHLLLGVVLILSVIFMH